jgi:hypothetical protein
VPDSRLIIAQSIGEYGGASGLMGQLVSLFESTTQSLQTSLREDTALWVAGAACLIVVIWLFRR